ncbi:MAG TPA: rhomboid family intramembrane serine protease [Anaerolineaceae bacterium]
MNIPPYNQPDQPPAQPPVAPNPGDEQSQGQPRTVAVSAPAIRPLVTYGIIGFTVLVYLGQLLSQSMYGQDLLINYGAMSSPLVAAGQIWRLLTPMLLHFSLIHIGSNMYSLYILGPSLERFYGHTRFLALYVLCGIGGNLLSFYMHGANAISAGASTAIFGLIAAEGVFIYRNRRIFGARARGMLNNTIFLVVLNLVIGVYMGFDNWGHLGGLVTGLAFGWFAGPEMGIQADPTGFALVDRREPGTVWLVAAVIFAIMAGLAFLRIARLS